MEKLLAYLEEHHPLSDGFKKFLAENLIPVSFPNRHILLEIPKVASHIYFLLDGFATSYILDRDGKITENFWKPGQFIIAFESFIYQRPSIEVIQLVQPSDLLCFSRDALTKALAEFPELYKILYIIMNQHYDHALKKLRIAKTADHAVQYLKLLEVFPGIENIVPQRAIATYLGITPQSLARIKRRLG